MMKPSYVRRVEAVRDRRYARKVLLAEVAGRVAAGLANSKIYYGVTEQRVEGRVHSQYYVADIKVAEDAVTIARGILGEIGL